MTLLHYLCTWVFVSAYWCATGEPGKCLPSQIGSIRRYCASVLPIALALPISITLNNTALVYIGAGLASIVGALSPVCTAVLSRLLGRSFSTTSLLGVLVAFAGAFYAGCTELRLLLRQDAHTDLHAQLKGLLFSAGALVMRATRVVLQDSLLSPSAYFGAAGTSASPEVLDAPEVKTGVARELRPEEVPLTGLQLLAVQSPAVVAVCMVFAVLTERPAEAWHALTPPIAWMLCLTCVIAVAVNSLGAWVLKELGSTSMQIIGKLNTIVTTAVSLAFFGENLPPMVLVGSAVVLIGVGIFEVGESRASAPAGSKQAV